MMKDTRLPTNLKTITLSCDLHVQELSGRQNGHHVHEYEKYPQLHLHQHL